MEKLIITAAICGAEVTKEQNPAVPYTISETVREAKAACDAGASVIHLHVREDDGTPSQRPERYQECVQGILSACPDVIIQITTGGAVGMTDEERLGPLGISPEPAFASLDCGSCNFGDGVFVNTDATIAHFAETLLNRGIKPELECFDKGMLDIAMKIYRKGLLKDPLHFNFVLGIQMAATLRDLSFCVDSLPPGATWTATGIGRGAFPMAAGAILMGGHARVGLEDNLFLEKGILARSNGELVEKVTRIAGLLGREIATPIEAAKILGIGKRE